MPFTVQDLTVTPTNVHPTCTHPLFNSNKLYDTKIDPNLHNVTTDSVLLYDGYVWTYEHISSLFGIVGETGPMGATGFTGPIGAQGITGPMGETGPIGATKYGVFCSRETQNMTIANLPVPMTYNITELSNGVSVVNYEGVNDSGIKVQNTGIYNIQFSAQINKKEEGSGQAETVYIWFAKNGVYIPRSNSSVVSSSTHEKSRVIAAWNIVLELLSTDVLQIFWVSSDEHIQLLYVDQQNISTNQTPPTTTTIPSIPSVILTVTQL